MTTKTLTPPTPTVTVIRTRDDLIDEGIRRFFSELSHLGILAEDLSDDELDRLRLQTARQLIPLGGSLGSEALYEALEDLHDIILVLVQKEQEKAGKLERTSWEDYLAEMYGDEVPSELRS